MILLYFAGFCLSILLLLIGLIKPSIVYRWGERRTRGRSTLLYGLLIVAFTAAMIATTPDTEDPGATQASSAESASTNSPLATAPTDETNTAQAEPESQVKEVEVSTTPTVSETSPESKVEKETAQMVINTPTSEYLGVRTIYEGEVNEMGNPHGEGIITYTFDDVAYILYEGQFNNGVYDGMGTTYYNGDTEIEFSGVFRNGEPVHYPLENEFYSNKGSITFFGDTDKQKTGDTMTVYYTGGNVYYSGGWKNAQPNGKGTTFYDIYPQRQLATGTFRNGLLHGEGTTFYRNGNHEQSGDFEDGQLNGKGKTYFENGSIYLEGTFKNGRLHGKGKSYYESGNLESEGTFEEGRLMGKAKLYHENGQLAFEGTYDDGFLKSYGVQGDGVLYHENGKLKYKGGFKNNQYHGQGTLYNDSGEVIQKGKWDEGTFIGD
ncbi:hypothetical protein NYE40_23915 [Paenibacillus sp. FSL W8-1187]|uniref:hypothetical protein n=1 Tax=Paenibacillus sp. FSL W8-1187 TaxID=2975339 RepID=UPI0030DA1D18